MNLIDFALRMINNDISYVYRDIPFPVQMGEEDLRSLVKTLLHEHLKESASAAFFNEMDDLDDIQDSLPDGWKLELDEESRQPVSTLRLFVYNQYDEAERSAGDDFESVTLKAKNLFGYTWVVDSVEVDDENANEPPLTLYSAEGDSPLCIGLYGGEEGEIYMEWDELDISFSEDSCIISEESLSEVVEYIVDEAG